ncbi:MAG: hypothetical protein IKO00_01595 [Oscillospiraceae bacterium]|nr:hypothetical protein [Oscillospiraceae bacterium]
MKKNPDIFCEVCGKAVDDDAIFTMDTWGSMLAFCSKECYEAHLSAESQRNMRGTDRAGSLFGRGGFGSSF